MSSSVPEDTGASAAEDPRYTPASAAPVEADAVPGTEPKKRPRRRKPVAAPEADVITAPTPEAVPAVAEVAPASAPVPAPMAVEVEVEVATVLPVAARTQGDVANVEVVDDEDEDEEEPDDEEDDLDRERRALDRARRNAPPTQPIRFNSPAFGGANHIKTSDLPETVVLVDGKQRLNAIREFADNKIAVFGGVFLKDFDDGDLLMRRIDILYQVNKLQTKKELLQWYLEMNEGHIAHTKEELDRVREMMKKV